MNTILNPDEIIIFGSGECAEIIANYAIENNIKINFFTDINSNKKELLNLPILNYDEVSRNKIYKQILAKVHFSF